MKIINFSFFIFLFIITAISCNKEAATSTTSLNEIVNINATLVINTVPGTFISYGENVSGVAKLFVKDFKYSLSLENFNTNNGPDLHVYLSKEIQPINFLDLGKLKSTSGNQVYTISGVPDFKQYKYALIHYQQYNHLFGSTDLIK